MKKSLYITGEMLNKFFLSDSSSVNGVILFERRNCNFDDEYYRITLEDEEFEKARMRNYGVYCVETLKTFNPKFEIYQLAKNFGPFESGLTFISARNLNAILVTVEDLKNNQPNADLVSLVDYHFKDGKYSDTIKNLKGNTISLTRLNYNIKNDEFTIHTEIDGEINTNVLEDCDDPYLTGNDIGMALEYMNQIIKFKYEAWCKNGTFV